MDPSDFKLIEELVSAETFGGLKKPKTKQPRGGKYHHVVVVAGFSLYFCLLCAVGWKSASKEQLHMVRRPKVCGIRTNISLSMHVWGA